MEVRCEINGFYQKGNTLAHFRVTETTKDVHFCTLLIDGRDVISGLWKRARSSFPNNREENGQPSVATGPSANRAGRAEPHLAVGPRVECFWPASKTLSYEWISL
jgi:hypothetical protein